MKLPQLIAILNAYLEEEPEAADLDVIIGMDSFLGYLCCEVLEIKRTDKELAIFTPSFENLNAVYKEKAPRK